MSGSGSGIDAANVSLTGELPHDVERQAVLGALHRIDLGSDSPAQVWEVLQMLDLDGQAREMQAEKQGRQEEGAA
ncbi:hypothetical protein EV383_4484 [Pseudonocardia sediminis]|uniref:Uncharacterized protein n=1 Tax=Pseudonocardia sediminis TaxID=1397368 RepID=A0A4Q7V4L6_PSEST|nr:hypothetical protein [Pseudonocardia sediminis]RZT87559.1 hypothetical protein EV383_4484 [Pseudonocardia sediminis]